MIDPEHDLSLSRLAKVLKLSRWTVYYKPRPLPASKVLVCKALHVGH